MSVRSLHALMEVAFAAGVTAGAREVGDMLKERLR